MRSLRHLAEYACLDILVGRNVDNEVDAGRDRKTIK
jgi:hypothetical protein